MSDAVRFWERRRLVYNAALAAVVVVWFVATWPHFRSALTWAALVRLAGLALAANICYCAAYLADAAAVRPAAAPRRDRRRALMWWAGTVLAVLFANYWIADEIYPFVR